MAKAKKNKLRTRTGPAGVSLDLLTLIGVTLAVGAIVLGNWLEGGHISVLMQLTAFIIVIGGTFGAVVIQPPSSDFRLAYARLRLEPRESLMRWAAIAQPSVSLVRYWGLSTL